MTTTKKRGGGAAKGKRGGAAASAASGGGASSSSTAAAAAAAAKSPGFAALRSSLEAALPVAASALVVQAITASPAHAVAAVGATPSEPRVTLAWCSLARSEVTAVAVAVAVGVAVPFATAVTALGSTAAKRRAFTRGRAAHLLPPGSLTSASLVDARDVVD